MQEILQKIDIRRLRLMLAGMLMLIFAILFSYLLMPQIKQYKSVLISKSVLENAAPAGLGLEQQLLALKSNVADLHQQLLGDTANLPANQIEAYIIGRLQKVSWNHNIELVSVQPGIGKKVHKFQEVLFNVELSADYFDFYNWLRALEKELGFIVVRQFEIKAAAGKQDGSRLAMFLTMVSYRAEQ